MPEALAIETRELTRRFDSRVAVNGLNLQVPRGAVYGFVGPNGAGKTTTIKLLLGLLHPTSGSVLIHGELLTPARRDLLRGIGMLVESPSLYPHLTGRENLEVARRMLDLPATALSDALSFVSLEPDADRLVRTYSLGMRQRLALALAWLGRPHLLVLDEPANGLDPAGIRAFRTQLQRLAQERAATVFLSSHVLSEVEQVATCLGIIKDGRLLFQGDVEQLRQQQTPLTLTVNRGAEAQRLLAASGWRVREEAGGILSVEVSSDADAAAVNRLLVEHEIVVYRLERKADTLEDLFLRAVSTSEEASHERSLAHPVG
jgi:ABC-type multidrug transport system ATPase subunit